MENASKKINSDTAVNAACIACGNTSHTLYAEKRGYKVWKCAKCKMLFLYPIPKPETAAQVYGKDYFAGAEKGFGYVDYDTDKEAMRRVFNKHLNHFESLLGGPGRMLDVGAATGFFMNIARERKWKVQGVEISDYAAGVARKKGLDVITGTMQTLATMGDNFQKESFDLITMWDVVEHMPDPAADISVALGLLKKRGLLAINTPDSGSLYAKMMKSKWHLFVPPEHIWYFNRASIAKLLEKSGFKVLEVGCIGKSFTVKYVVNFLYLWQKLAIWKALSSRLEHSRLGRFAVPINFRDNMYVLAEKK